MKQTITPGERLQLIGLAALGERYLAQLAEAAAESGYSADHLGQLLKDGTIPN